MHLEDQQSPLVLSRKKPRHSLFFATFFAAFESTNNGSYRQTIRERKKDFIKSSAGIAVSVKEKETWETARESPWCLRMKVRLLLDISWFQSFRFRRESERGRVRRKLGYEIAFASSCGSTVFACRIAQRETRNKTVLRSPHFSYFALVIAWLPRYFLPSLSSFHTPLSLVFLTDGVGVELLQHIPFDFASWLSLKWMMYGKGRADLLLPAVFGSVNICGHFMPCTFAYSSIYPYTL